MKNFFCPHLWLIRFLGLIVPRRLRADWRLEWESELRHREAMLAEWDRLSWRYKLDLFRRSTSAFWDALWLQPHRMEDEMMQDLRYGIRMLAKNFGSTMTMILTLALGIGATTAIFSVVDAILMRPLPYPEPERLVLIREVGEKGGTSNMAEPNFEDLRDRNRSFDAVALSTNSFPLAVTGGNEPGITRIAVVSGQFFNAIGVQPTLGRVFSAEEEVFGGPVAVVISHRYWQTRLNGRADFAAAKLNVDGVGCNVVGVMPPGFDYPSQNEIWMSRNSEPQNKSRTAHNWPVLARLRAGVTMEQARAEVSGIAGQLRAEHGKAMDAVDFRLIPLQEYMTRNVREGLWLLLGAVSLLFLVACANVSNLLLAQFTARRREFTIRAALGAGRLRMARQLIFENLLLALPAAALGALLARGGISLLLSLEGGYLPKVNEIAVNGRVWLFACGLAALVAVLLGLLPMLQFKKPNLHDGLKEAGRGQSAGALGGRLRNGLVVAQLALTLVLLVGAGLLGRSFLKLWQTDPGFETGNALAMTLSLPSTVSKDEDERLRQFYSQLLERIKQIPGVASAGGVNVLPLTGGGANGRFLLDDNQATPGDAVYLVASGGYFDAMKIPLRRGRMFDAQDTVDSPHVAVISQSLAAKYFGASDPIGRTIQFGNMDSDKRLLHIVGVVGDIRDGSLEADAGPTVYAYSLQRPQWWQVSRLSIVVRSSLPAADLIPALRAIVPALRPDVPLRFRTLDEVFAASLDQRRFSLTLFGVFAVVALLIAAIGIYGVVSYAVTQRTQEIGIRLALGASRRDVLGLVLRHGTKLAVFGIVIGSAGGLFLTGYLKNMLFGVAPSDPLTFAIIALLLLAIAVLACLLPARRATKTDPMIALRCE